MGILSMVVDPSGQAAIVGERGPELITGANGGMSILNTESRNDELRWSDESPTVNFNLTAVDTNQVFSS